MSMEVVRGFGVRETTMRMVGDSRKAENLEGPGKPAQDLGFRLECTGLLPHRLLIICIVVVDAPVRGHVFTP